MSRITEAFDGRAPPMKFGSLLLAVVGSAMGLCRRLPGDRAAAGASEVGYRGGRTILT